MNSSRSIATCLQSIQAQDYPADQIQIIISDGGSEDDTLKIVTSFKNVQIIFNPKKIAATGKSLGIASADGDIIALVDSDNELIGKNWLKSMLEPFSDPKIVATEPLYYALQSEDHFINRYCAMTSANDPLTLWLGNYDRFNILTKKWTDLFLKQRDCGDYIEVKLEADKLIPTIGANGFLVRAKALQQCQWQPYLYDVDIPYDLVKLGYYFFAKVKVSIAHHYVDNFKLFCRKQRRRVSEYLTLKHKRHSWLEVNPIYINHFIFDTVTVLPLLWAIYKGYQGRKDPAWWFHLPACWATLIIYSYETLNFKLLGSRNLQPVSGTEINKP